MDVNYKNPKYYNTAKLPIRQPLIFTGLMAGLCKLALMGQDSRSRRWGWRA